jgi:arginyl-tRNA synthetase
VADKIHEVMKKNDAKYKQVDNPKETADILEISSLMFQDMSCKDCASFLGHSYIVRFGVVSVLLTFPFLRARVNNYNMRTPAFVTILRKVDPDASLNLSSAQLNLLVEPHTIDLARYPDTVRNRLKSHEPITVLILE